MRHDRTIFGCASDARFRILRTIRDACDYMTGMDEKRELRSHWQRACKLILAKADVLTVSRALELALFMDVKLDVSKVPAK